MILKKGAFTDFARRVKETKKGIILYGAGVIGQVVAPYWLRQHGIEDRVICYVDVDPYKQGQTICLESIQAPIRSLSVLDEEQDRYILLVTVSAFEPVVQTLERILGVKTAEVYFLPIMLLDHAHAGTGGEIIKSSDIQLIPERIHYCWFSGNPIPERLQKCIDSWKYFCPGYEIIRWDESNYDVSQNKYMYQAYKAGKLGFVPDYARLDIVYKYGGIYLDTDVELISTMDELVYQPAFAGVDGSWRVSLGLGFGAVKGSPIMGELREQYSELTFYDEYGDLNMIAAPALQEKIFMQKGYQKNGEYQIVDGMTIYPEKILSAKCNTTGRILPTSRTVAIHHFDGSWVDEEKRIKIKKIQSLFQKETGDNDGERCRENDSEI